TCPQCGSIDTAEQNFLHCYSCGHVGTQDEYLTNEGLACPKCAVRLRHIGVDYDRALETFGCKDCSGRFTEPKVKARCLECRKTCVTDALAERKYYGLQPSAAGERAARTGDVGDLFRRVHGFDHAHPDCGRHDPPRAHRGARSRSDAGGWTAYRDHDLLLRRRPRRRGQHQRAAHHGYPAEPCRLMDAMLTLTGAWLTLLQLLEAVWRSDWIVIALKFFPFVLMFELPIQALVMLGGVRRYIEGRRTARYPLAYHPSVSCVI